MEQQLTTQEYLIHIDKHPKSIYVLHEKLERRFPVHQHTKGQLTYVEGGIAFVHLRLASLVIPARHYIWIPQGTEHFLQIGHTATAIRTIYFNEDAQTDEFYNRTGIYPVNNLLHEMIIYTEKFNGVINPRSKSFVFLTAIKDLLPQLNTPNLPIALPTTQNQRLRPVLQYLNAHIAQTHNLSTVSTAFGLSERTLSRLFQATLSISFIQYLRQLRVVKAVEMMLQTDLTLSQIAYATGYQSISAFSNVFFQITKVRPSAFAALVR